MRYVHVGEADLLTLILAAQRQPHFHRVHAKWDEDGTRCHRCEIVSNLAEHIGMSCGNCSEHAAQTPAQSPGEHADEIAERGLGGYC